MSKINNGLKIVAVFALLLLALGQVNANILANVSVDKDKLAIDEMGALVIDLFNDVNFEQKDVQLRIEAGSGIVFPENDDKQIIVEKVDSIKGLSRKEVKVRIKGAIIPPNPNPLQGTAEVTTSNIFVYYGTKADSDQPKYASGTFVTIVPASVLVDSSAQKITTDGEQSVEIDYKITNNSGSDINVMAEMIVPNGFDIQTAPIVLGPIRDNNSSSGKFIARAPLNVNGDQKLTLSYGYTDTNGGHYFEKNFTMSFQKSNSLYLGVIGVIVLIIAIFIFIKKTKGDPNVKGTGEKKK